MLLVFRFALSTSPQSPANAEQHTNRHCHSRQPKTRQRDVVRNHVALTHQLQEAPALAPAAAAAEPACRISRSSTPLISLLIRAFNQPFPPSSPSVRSPLSAFHSPLSSFYPPFSAFRSSLSAFHFPPSTLRCVRCQREMATLLRRVAGDFRRSSGASGAVNRAAGSFQSGFAAHPRSLIDASTLVVAEHTGRGAGGSAAALKPPTLSAVAAARKLGGPVAVLVAGSGDAVADVAAAVAKIEGVDEVITTESPALDHALPEPLAALLTNLAAQRSFSHVLAASSTFSRNVLPRVAALLDAAMVSDVVEIVDETTFCVLACVLVCVLVCVRECILLRPAPFPRSPIHAGDALATVPYSTPFILPFTSLSPSSHVLTCFPASSTIPPSPFYAGGVLATVPYSTPIFPPLTISPSPSPPFSLLPSSVLPPPFLPPPSPIYAGNALATVRCSTPSPAVPTLLTVRATSFPAASSSPSTTPLLFTHTSSRDTDLAEVASYPTLPTTSFVRSMHTQFAAPPPPPQSQPAVHTTSFPATSFLATSFPATSFPATSFPATSSFTLFDLQGIKASLPACFAPKACKCMPKVSSF
ncbi:unnamed protein product [Closterium sp. NIES-54]